MQVVIHSLYVFRPVAVTVHIPCKCFYIQLRFPADMCELEAAPLDVLTLDAFLFTGDDLLFPVSPIAFSMDALFTVITPAGGL